jgi:hypothetical protein
MKKIKTFIIEEPIRREKKNIVVIFLVNAIRE